MPVSRKALIIALAFAMLVIARQGFAEARLSFDLTGDGKNPESQAKMKIDKGGSFSEAEVKGCKLVTAQTLIINLNDVVNSVEDAQKLMNEKKTEIEQEAFGLGMSDFELNKYSHVLTSKNETSAFLRPDQTAQYQLNGELVYDFSNPNQVNQLITKLKPKNYETKLSSREYEICQ